MFSAGRGGTIHASVADMHIGATIALGRQRLTLADGGAVLPARAQCWLWSCWLDFWREVWRLKRDTGFDLYVELVGDIWEGYHHRSVQVTSLVESDQFKQAYEIVEGLVQMADMTFFVKGTSAHDGQLSWRSEILAEALARVYPGKIARDRGTGQWSFWELEMETQGVILNFQHHGSLGRLPWTVANLAHRTAVEIELKALRQGREPPHLAFRGDRHVYANTGDNHRVQVIHLPCWGVKNEYAQRYFPNHLPDIGGVITLCQGGRYEVIPRRYCPQPAPRWQPE